MGKEAILLNRTICSWRKDQQQSCQPSPCQHDQVGAALHPVVEDDAGDLATLSYSRTVADEVAFALCPSAAGNML
jgi:hypothetical protein